MFDSGYYTEAELREAGFKSVGENVSIARNCTVIGLQNISLGNNVRIDGYCSLIAADTGYLKLGSYIHIGSYCYLSAGSGVVMNDFSGLSQGVCIYSKSDDYSGKHLTNPTVPQKFLGITEGEVELGRHVIVGSGSVILPKVTIGEGSAVAALSLVTKRLDSWGVYGGCPAKRLKARRKDLVELERELLSRGPE